MIKFILKRAFSIQRQRLHYDVLIIGAGPAGLATAIRLKQNQIKYGKQLNVCIIQKAAAIGNHILGGNCFETKGFNQLFPQWQTMEVIQFFTDQTSSQQQSENGSFLLLLQLEKYDNDGNYIISLGHLCQWMAVQAEQLGVEIFTHTPAAEPLYDKNNNLIGVVTSDTGISKTGKKKQNYSPGIQITANQTVLAEGCRGSISEKVIRKYDLRKNSDPQTYGLGLKQIWEIPQQNFIEGYVQHSIGWPFTRNMYGGAFLYLMKPNLVHVGFVVGLDYKDPYFNPYEEFQLHAVMKKFLKGGKCISYGARTMNEGGYYSLPKLTFPGGVLVGCAAGFLNILKLKGSHTAMKSGIIAGDQIYQRLKEKSESILEITSYQDQIKKSWAYQELYFSRNFRNSFKNLYTGLLYGLMLTVIFKGREPWSLRKKINDSQSITTNVGYKQRPKVPQTQFTFPILENLERSGTNHQHNQPNHLKIKEGMQNVNSNNKKAMESLAIGGPEERFCPAKVYEFVDDKLVINAQNCLHCKACDIKMKEQYIEWTVPQGGGGPKQQLQYKKSAYVNLQFNMSKYQG